MNKASSICATLLCVFWLSGCVSNPEKTNTLEQYLENADKAAQAGKLETAVEYLDTAAKNYPTSEQPWVKKARLYFEGSNYPAAIQSADEAMKRSSDNKDAKAIAVVSSLRVAIRALSSMRGDVTLMTNSDSQKEALMLAQSLRETLKTRDIFGCSSASSSTHSMHSSRSTGVTAPSSRSSSSGKKQEPGNTGRSTGGNSDPFHGL